MEEPERVRTAMIILTCPWCGRAVKVFGRVRRVLCACGEILMENEPSAKASNDRAK